MDKSKQAKWTLFEQRFETNKFRLAANYSFFENGSFFHSSALAKDYENSNVFFKKDLQGKGLERIKQVKNSLNFKLDKLFEERRQLFLSSKYADYDVLFFKHQVPAPHNSEKLSLAECFKACTDVYRIEKQYILTEKWYTLPTESLIDLVNSKERFAKQKFIEIQDEKFELKMVEFNQKLRQLKWKFSLVQRWSLAAAEFAAMEHVKNIDNSLLSGTILIQLGDMIYFFEWNKYEDLKTISLKLKESSLKKHYQFANLEIG